jgi:hypothetical protein
MMLKRSPDYLFTTSVPAHKSEDQERGRAFNGNRLRKSQPEEMGITNRQLLSAFIRHPNEARPGSHPITT